MVVIAVIQAMVDTVVISATICMAAVLEDIAHIHTTPITMARA